MALFKIFKGNSSTLPETYKDGYCYFTIDDGKMYIDTSNATDGSGGICLNAKTADFSLSAKQADKLSSAHITASSDLDGFFEEGVFKTATYSGAKDIIQYIEKLVKIRTKPPFTGTLVV